MQHAPLDVSLYRFKRLHASSPSHLVGMAPGPINTAPVQSDSPAIEVRKENEKKTIADKQTITQVAQKANRALLHISSVFPFDFFPDELIITDTEVHVIFHTFFASEQLHTVDIGDITNVFVETAPIFATIIIVSRTFTENQITLRLLKKKDAARARDLIDGLRLLRRQHVDVTKIPNDELMQKLNEFSTTSITQQVV